MKKVVSIVLVLVMMLTLAVSLCSCEKAECDICGEEKTVNSMHVEEVFGKKIYTCKDCYEDLESIGNLFD